MSSFTPGHDRHDGTAATASPPTVSEPLFVRLCTRESIREAISAPQDASRILVGALANALDQAHHDYAKLLRESDLVYGELNKALGEHAPKAWDRIEEALRRG